MENKKVFVINAGSSSIKLQLLDKKTLEVIVSGLAERITLKNGVVTLKYQGEKHVKNVDMADHTKAVEVILEMLKELEVIKDAKEIEIIGFRVVHGATYFSKPTVLGDKEIAIIDKVKVYAPLHNPGAIQAIQAFKKIMPHAKMMAEFDTAFHTTIPAVNATYPIPFKYSQKFGIKKYGAHGISHEYITGRLGEILKKKKVNFVNLHIGNGASLCAIKDSKSFDTSMGLTPLAGIMMGTRSGDIDPSIHQFLAHQLNIDIDEVTEILNKKSGLLGVSGISSDLRDIADAIVKGDKQAIFAFDLYTQRIADVTSCYANKIATKLDALVFTAGGGENDPDMRKKVIEKLHFAKIKIDDKLNKGQWNGDYKLISTGDSEIKVYAIRTNEELLIAKHAIQLFK